MMNYTKEQELNIAAKLKVVNINYLTILNVIKDNTNSTLMKIQQEVKLGKYVIDKCIIALNVTNLIETTVEGVNRYYNITKDGEKFIKDIGGR